MPRGSNRARVLRGLAAWVVVATVAAIAACSQQPLPRAAAAPAQPATSVAGAAAAAPATSAEMLKLGRDVYNYRCYFCHGYSGDAKTLATTYMLPKPRDFQHTRPEDLPYERILSAVRSGRPGTAMKGFTGIIDDREMQAVSAFVRDEFLLRRAPNSAYHTKENGWPDHERNARAFPFARGEIAIDTPWDKLTPQQQDGLRLFRSACITCHDHGRVENAGVPWETRPLSFPRDGYCTSCHQDTPKSAPQGSKHPQRPATHTFSGDDGSVPVRPRTESRVGDAFLVHDKPPVLADATALERRGEQLFQGNCAFCHAGDGTSKSWIGSFLEPHPRNLASDDEMRGMTRERLARSIADGLPGTSMPAWKHVFGPRDIDALMAYISRAFHPVAGVPRS